MIYVKILEWLRQGRKFMELFNKIPSSSPNLISEPIGLNIAQCFQSRLQSSNGCHRRWRPSLVGSWLGLLRSPGPGLCNIKIFAASRASNQKYWEVWVQILKRVSPNSPKVKANLWIRNREFGLLLSIKSSGRYFYFITLNWMKNWFLERVWGR